MNTYGGGLITILVYGNYIQPPQNSVSIMTEDNFDILTEDSMQLLTESTQS